MEEILVDDEGRCQYYEELEKLKNLSLGDIVELTNLNKTTMRYKINDIIKTTPNDISILQTKDNSIRELTLITCTNGNKERLVVKAKEQT